MMLCRLLLLALLPCALSACGLLRDRPPEYEPVQLASGVRVQDLVVPEEGPVAASGDRVTIDYRLALLDGTVADSSRDRGQPISFVLGDGEVPAGLEQGIQGMRLLGRRRVRIPPELGYGSQGRPPRIPPDSVLVVDVELLALERAGSAP
jgi:FKBP-type peptidyl-prolyl cis-trans isomerase